MTQSTPNEIVSEKLQQLRSALSTVIVGQEKLIDCLLMALLTSGHLLLEGVPGLAKTTTILALGKLCHVDFKRIQFTPDLLPSDLIGSQIFDPKTQEFWVKKGPIFTNFLLADEINRAPAKLQSALLECMQELQVTLGDESIPLPKPFLVLATQNPIEQEGTFSLPEAQVDRFFMKVILDYPSAEEELLILQRSSRLKPQDLKPIFKEKDLLELPRVCEGIFLDEKLERYITQIVLATRHPEQFSLGDLKPFIAFGASPRGTIALARASKAHALLEGRDYATPDDVKAVAFEVLRHRVILTFEAEAESLKSEMVIQKILDQMIVP